MPASQKGYAIEYLFDLHWDAAAGQLLDPVVTLDEVQAAIAWSNTNHGTALSARNPANFMKDIVRGSGGNRMWPARLRRLRIAAEQTMGDRAAFRFVPYRPGQTEPFPNPFEYREGETPRFQVQSLSLPEVVKRLGRDDETYLIQVAVKLAVIETHFALASSLRGRVSEVHHLQVGLKLRLAEIDTLFLASVADEQGRQHQMLITVEAKKRGQRIVEEQILRQVRAVFDAVPTVDRVVPLGLTTIREGGMYVVEFQEC